MSILPALLILLQIPSFSQSGCEGDIVLTTQEEIDAFTCETLEGDLHLILSEALDLEPLTVLREVKGTLIIDFNPDLDLYPDGLRNLHRAGAIQITTGGGSSWDTRFDIGVFEQLTAIGALTVSEVRLINSFPALTQLDFLAMYSSYFTDISWLENIDFLQSLTFQNQVVAEQIEALLAKVKKGGDVSMTASNFGDLGGLKGVDYLNLLEITGSNGISFDGLSDLDSTNYFRISDTHTSGGCCGLAPYLGRDPQPVVFEFTGNSCSLSDIPACKNSCPGDILVGTQSDADNFTCAVVQGNLTLTGNYVYYDSLEVLEEVKGDLIIEDLMGPFGLNGLQNLHTVGGDVIIRNNQVLGNTQSLFRLTAVGGDIRVENNPDLTSVRGLENATAPVNLSVQNNPELVYCCELEALAARATGMVEISANGAYCSVSGFDECVTEQGECLGDVYVQNQDEADLFDCESIRGSFHLISSMPLDGSELLKLDSVTENVKLRLDYAEFDGLTNLAWIGGELAPTSNKLFGADIHLGGLSGLRHLGGINTALTRFEGQLWVEGTLNYVSFGYATEFLTINWIPNVTQVDSLWLSEINESQVDVNHLMSLLPEDGIVYMGNPNLENFSGLQGKTELASLSIDAGTAQTLDGMEDLRTIGDLKLNYLFVLDNCCGLYNLLTDGTITGDFLFIVEGCTIEGIISGCAPAEEIPSSVYPNPSASNAVTIKWTGDDQQASRVQVLDNFGKVVMQSELGARGGIRTAVLDISRLPSGTFLVRIITGKNAELRRLVRE